ncbi:hypothetical protein SNEBB_004440 [Seison nebaliae]|nr:hypothetical protein SNEBB_004440 [Seison nebaliae]
MTTVDENEDMDDTESELEEDEESIRSKEENMMVVECQLKSSYSKCLHQFNNFLISLKKNLKKPMRNIVRHKQRKLKMKYIKPKVGVGKEQEIYNQKEYENYMEELKRFTGTPSLNILLVIFVKMFNKHFEKIYGEKIQINIKKFYPTSSIEFFESSIDLLIDGKDLISYFKTALETQLYPPIHQHTKLVASTNRDDKGEEKQSTKLSNIVHDFIERKEAKDIWRDRKKYLKSLNEIITISKDDNDDNNDVDNNNDDDDDDEDEDDGDKEKIEDDNETIEKFEVHKKTKKLSKKNVGLFTEFQKCIADN